MPVARYSDRQALGENLIRKTGYSGFRYDEKARDWHAVIGLFLGVLVSIFGILGLLDIMQPDLETLFIPAFGAYPGLIGRNSATKGSLAMIGLTMSGASFLVQFFLFQLQGIRFS